MSLEASPHFQQGSSPPWFDLHRASSSSGCKTGAQEGARYHQLKPDHTRGACTHFTHNRNGIIIDPRTPTMLGRCTPGFTEPTGQTALAPSAKRRGEGARYCERQPTHTRGARNCMAAKPEDTGGLRHHKLRPEHTRGERAIVACLCPTCTACHHHYHQGAKTGACEANMPGDGGFGGRQTHH